MLILILLLLLKTHDYMFLLSLYQQKTIRNYQNFLEKNLKNWCIEINILTKSENKNTENKYR